MFKVAKIGRNFFWRTILDLFLSKFYRKFDWKLRWKLSKHRICVVHTCYVNTHTPNGSQEQFKMKKVFFFTEFYSFENSDKTLRGGELIFLETSIPMSTKYFFNDSKISIAFIITLVNMSYGLCQHLYFCRSKE